MEKKDKIDAFLWMMYLEMRDPQLSQPLISDSERQPGIKLPLRRGQSKGDHTDTLWIPDQTEPEAHYTSRCFRYVKEIPMII